MTEIQLFSYIAITISAIGITSLLWRAVKQLEREALQEQSARAQVHEERVVLEDGFHPDTVVVKVGQPLRLNFTRRETAECGDLMMPDFSQRVNLPVNKMVTVEITPDRPGEYVFSCEATAVAGRLIVEPS